ERRTTYARETAAALPEGVREVIDNRFSRVSPGCREALAVAAVAGEEFAFDVLARGGADRPVLPSPDALLDALGQAETARLVHPEGSAGRYRFAHALIREAAYGALAGAQAEAATAWRDGARHYERCLTLMADLGDDAGGDEAALLTALGRCQRND